MSKSLICRRYQKSSRRGTEMTVPDPNMICSEKSPWGWHQFHIAEVTIGYVTEVSLVFLTFLLISTSRLFGTFLSYVFQRNSRCSGHSLGPCPQVCFFLKKCHSVIITSTVIKQVTYFVYLTINQIFITVFSKLSLEHVLLTNLVQIWPSQRCVLSSWLHRTSIISNTLLSN